MGHRHEEVVRSFLECVVAGDLEAALNHYADDATFHVAAWREPLVGREAISDALRREVRLPNYRYTILNIASNDAVTFIEVVDEFKHGGKNVTMHWSGVWEINHAGKITARRDYWDTKEFEARESQTADRAQDRAEVLDVLNRYGEAADRRDWSMFDQVFTPDATADYPTSKLVGREAIVKLIRNALGGCGPTQHLLANHTVRLDGDEAHASCKVRAFSQGAGDRSAGTHELLGTYYHDLVRTRDGWRTRHLRMEVAVELGTRDALQPER
jgi:limonene-1,2-epoxide hydrolase